MTNLSSFGILIASLGWMILDGQDSQEDLESDIDDENKKADKQNKLKENL